MGLNLVKKQEVKYATGNENSLQGKKQKVQLGCWKTMQVQKDRNG